MNLPDKVTCYNESVISLFPEILKIVRHKQITANELYSIIKVKNIVDFIDALETLYALRKLDMKNGVLYYVV